MVYLTTRMADYTMTLTDALDLAMNHYRQGNLQHSRSVCESVLQADPENVDALQMLAFIASGEGKNEDALQHLQRAVELDPGFAGAHFNLGNLLAFAGRSDEAVASFRRALAVEPDVPAFRFNLALELRKLGETEAALAEYRKVVELQPDHFEAHVNLGVALFACDRPAEAIACYERAMVFKADSPELLNNFGAALTAVGEFNRARSVLESAVDLDGSFVEARRNLGVVYTALGKADAAREAYLRAVETRPDYFDGWLELGAVQLNAGDAAAARDSFARAEALMPTALAPKWGKCFANLSPFYEDEAKLKSALRQYELELSELSAALDLSSEDIIADAASVVGFLQPFFLGCHEINARDLQAKYGDLCVRIMTAKYPQWSQTIAKRPVASGGKLRVGFVSRHFSNHCDWKMLTGGWVENLDRSQFELFAYSTGGTADDTTARARELFDSFVEGLGFEALCDRIGRDDLHILIFPETGQDPVTFRAACLRLAPVQCVAWGMPMTSGLPTIDYYLTADAMEPAGAQSHYREQIVRLPKLSSYYIPPSVPARTDTLEAHGVRVDNAVRFLCVQSLFKYLPRYDEIFPRIAQRVPNAQFLFAAKPEGLADKLNSRLRAAFAKFGMRAEDYVTMLPCLTHTEFAGLCSVGDVFLDTFEFTGCNTTLEVLPHGVPVVTHEGAYMRGRQSAAILHLLGVRDTVAASVDEYLEKAVELAQNPALRKEIGLRVRDRLPALYRDREPVEALQRFLVDIAAAD
jgi:protein O-GlcNAc transferase